jgi:hypothetical protein
MGLTGNLRTMDLPEILQWVSVGRKTGTLHLGRGSIEKRIVFRDGVVYTSWSNDPRESLGQHLVRQRRLNEDQLYRAMLQHEQRKLPLGSVLIDAGLLEEDELRGLLEQKAQESIYDVFLWPEGRFEFVDGEIQEDVQVFLDMPVTSVVLEGARRLDEWRRIRLVIPSAHTTFNRPPGAALPLPGTPEAQAVELAEAGKTAAEIAQEMRRSEFEGATLLYALLNQGTLAVHSAKDSKDIADPVETIRELMSAAYARIGERRYDQAIEAYDAVLSMDPLNQHAKQGRHAAADARNRLRAVRTVPMDKVPFLAIDLAELTSHDFDPQEGFVLSRVNGEWDVRAILKLCPIPEEEALLIFTRLLERSVIEFR